MNIQQSWQVVGGPLQLLGLKLGLDRQPVSIIKNGRGETVQRGEIGLLKGPSLQWTVHDPCVELILGAGGHVGWLVQGAIGHVVQCVSEHFSDLWVPPRESGRPGPIVH